MKKYKKVLAFIPLKVYNKSIKKREIKARKYRRKKT